MSAEHTRVVLHLECIEWTGARDQDGYGRVNFQGKWRGAHRVAYERARGPIPEGLVIDHLCRNRACINPSHMECVTSAENTRRGREATKTACIAGHPLFGSNLFIESGRRRCRECCRTRWRAYRLRKMEAGTWTRR
jgi:hypothetical protein